MAWQPLPNNQLSHDDTYLFAREESKILLKSMDSFTANFSAANQDISDRNTALAIGIMRDQLDLFMQHTVYPTPEALYDLSLSLDGMGVEMKADVKQGNVLALHLPLPQGFHVICSAEAVNSIAAGEPTQDILRLRFRDFLGNGRTHLNRFLMSRS